MTVASRKPAPRSRQTLAWLFLFASVFGLALSAFIASSSREALRATTPLLREKLPLLEDLGSIERQLLAIQTVNYQYFAYSINRASYQEQCVALHRSFQSTLGRLERTFPGDAGLEIIRAARDNFVKQEPKLDDLMQAEKVDWDEARAVLVEMTIDSGDIRRHLSSLRQRIEQSVVEAGETTEHSIERMVSLVSAYSVLIFGIALLVAYHIRARTRAEENLVHNATHDLVTGRHNRRALEARIGEVADADYLLTVVAIERFHRLVGTLGHEVADEALRTIARRIESDTAPVSAELFRLDGANFALICPGDTDTEDRLVAAVLGIARQPIRVGPHELLIAVSCGTARFVTDGGDAVTLLRSANTALEHAKRSQAAHVRFDPVFNARGVARLATEAAFGHAVERGELELHYQPQMDIASGRVIGAEALVRWRRDGRLISPADFIPVAEESGLIVGIGDWVLREACRQAAAWRLAGLGELVVAVNISARQFLDPRFHDNVVSALTETGTDAELIELEITESAIMQNPDGVAGELARLRALGLALAIDDFGTGYSSLAYLKRFPLDKLKIDQSFVRHLSTVGDAGDRAIVEAVVRLGQTLGLRVIAEGVETEEHRGILSTLGCDEIQGYWFAKPLPADAATAFIAARRAV
jgi:diguanylate cyclase (GGDEF)-like protein